MFGSMCAARLYGRGEMGPGGDSDAGSACWDCGAWASGFLVG